MGNKKDMSQGEAKFLQNAMQRVANKQSEDVKNILHGKKPPSKQETEMIKRAMMEATQSNRQLKIDAGVKIASAEKSELKAKPNRISSKRVLRGFRNKKWLPSQRGPSRSGPAHIKLDEED